MDADAKNHEPISPDCERRRVYDVTIMDLPRVILVLIVSKLPIKSIFSCKCVCKSWYNLPSDPLFLKMFHPFPSLLLSVLDNHERYVSSILELKAGYDYNSCPLNRPILFNPRFCLPHPKLILSGSCNGFLCLLNGDSYNKNHSVYICNPLLGEYIQLNLPNQRKCASYGFCFSEVSGQYKVVRSVITRLQGGRDVAHLEVYTLGLDKNWRNWGEAPPPKDSFGNFNVNGALHWISYDMSDDMSDDSYGSGYPLLIYYFDIETEKVHSLPIPHSLGEFNFLTLGELQTDLCLIDTTDGETHIDIWWMKEYGFAESWTKGRILMDCFPPDIDDFDCDDLIPKVIWKDGEILIQTACGTQLVSYNPKENEFRKVNVYSSGSPTIFIDKYVPSFYSLKTIMGDNFQVKNVYPQPKIV